MPLPPRHLCHATAAALLCACSFPAAASLYSPRIVGPHNADTYSLKTFAQFPRWKDLEGDAKAYEVFKYLADKRTGLYPLGTPAREGDDPLVELTMVTDPIKMLNVYPMGFCGALGPTMAGIAEGMGLGPGRTLIIPGWHHVASETFYNGQWHYLDLDVRAAFRRPDGSLASIEDARRDPSLWQQPNGPLFFPLDDLASAQKAYKAEPIGHQYGVAPAGHTMDFLLRPGETLTRWWKPQGGRWNHHPTLGTAPHPRNLIEKEPRGPKCKHPSFTVHTHGNGRFVYKPNLTSACRDFAEGAYDSRNVITSEHGLTLATAGEGFAIFEIRSPYVIVPLVNDLDSREDDREASVVKIDAQNVSLSISTNNGIAWLDLGPSSSALDLTPHVSGKYGYLLKVTLRGEPKTTALRSLEVTTWTQLHPASLPALRQGKNQMRLVTGDHNGLKTRLLAITPDTFQPAEFLKHLHEAPKDFDPKRHTRRIAGPLTLKVQAPPKTKIAWLSAGASFATYVGASDRTKNSIDYALGSPENFQNLYHAEVPPDQYHWHYNADRELKLPQPAETVYLRYSGDPAVNNIRVYAHCLDDQPRASQPLTVKHVWTENNGGNTKQFQVTVPDGASYEVEAAGEPTDDSIEISLPSLRL